MRVSPAMTRADSIRHTASMAPRVSVASTATDDITKIQGKATSKLGDLGPFVTARAVLAGAGIVQLAQFALTLPDDAQELLCQRHGLFFRVGFQDGEPANQLLRFGERAVSYGDVAVGTANTRSQHRRKAAFGRKQPTRLHALFDQLAHGRHFVRGRRCVALDVLVDAQESHSFSLLERFAYGAERVSPLR